MNNKIFTKGEVQDIYDELASTYNLSLLLFKIIGFRVQSYRREAIQNLYLNPDDTVVDLGCGTGLNFDLLQEKVGPKGKIIGVDLSAKMLEEANNRTKKKGWKNVELIQSDMSEFQIPDNTGGVLSTMAITMSPEYDEIIKGISDCLSKDKRMSIFELQKPKGWPQWLIKVMVELLKPYGTRYEHTQRTPCISIKKHFKDVTVQNRYLGSVCIASGSGS